MTPDEFFDVLVKVEGKWVINEGQFLRLYQKEWVSFVDCYCPITAVYLKQTGKPMKVGEAGIAGMDLDLPHSFIQRVIRAADHFHVDFRDVMYDKDEALLINAMRDKLRALCHV